MPVRVLVVQAVRPISQLSCRGDIKSHVYATADRNLSVSAPSYIASWAMEATLDVSWCMPRRPKRALC